MHVALLAIRPGALASNYVAPAAPVMAVRMLPVPAEAKAVPTLPEAQAVSPPAQVAPALPVPEPRVTERPAADSRADPNVAAPRSAVPARTAEVRPAPTATPPAPEAGTREARDRDQPTAATTSAREPKSADPPLPAAPDYALGIRLDPGPRPIGEIEPDYPDTVRLREGVVVLRLLISDTGHVDDVGVIRSEPRGVFEQAAIDAFSKARFSPGLAAGTPVKSQITVEVQFMPINRGARVSGRTY
jgi:protein TonB